MYHLMKSLNLVCKCCGLEQKLGQLRGSKQEKGQGSKEVNKGLI